MMFVVWGSLLSSIFWLLAEGQGSWWKNGRDSECCVASLNFLQSIFFSNSTCTFCTMNPSSNWDDLSFSLPGSSSLKQDRIVSPAFLKLLFHSLEIKWFFFIFALCYFAGVWFLSLAAQLLEDPWCSIIHDLSKKSFSEVFQVTPGTRKSHLTVCKVREKLAMEEYQGFFFHHLEQKSRNQAVNLVLRTLTFRRRPCREAFLTWQL